MKRLLILIATLLSLSASAQFKNVQIPQNDYPVNGNIIQRVNNQWRTRTLAQLRVDLNIADSSYILEALESYVPTSRTITINGDTFDLSENRSWTVTAALDTASLSDRINLKQNADADLTIYASITPTTVAQSLLAFANPSAIRFLRVNADNTVSGRTAAEVLSDIGAAASGHDHSGVYQAADADLTTYAGITPTTIGQNLLSFTNPSAVRYFKINADNTITGRTAAEMLSDLGAASSAHDHSALYQPLDANLTTYASIAPSTVAQGILSLANPSAVRYLKINADNSVSFRTAAEMLGDVGGAALAGGNTISGDQTFSDQIYAPAVEATAETVDSVFIRDAVTGKMLYARFSIPTVGNPEDGNDTALSADGAFDALAVKVEGPASATDNAIARFDNTTGKLVQNSSATISDAGKITATFQISGATGSRPLETDGSGNIIEGEAAEQIEYRYEEIKALRAFGSTFKYRVFGATAQSSTSSLALADGTNRILAVHITQADTITGVAYTVLTAGDFTADNENRIGLYSVNTSTGTRTLVASSANDATGSLWKSTGTIKVAFSTPYIAAPGAYCIGLIYNNSAQVTAPTLLGPSETANRPFTLDQTIKMWGARTASTLESSITEANIASTNRLYLAWLY
jgi:hypothetical protein